MKVKEVTNLLVDSIKTYFKELISDYNEYMLCGKTKKTASAGGYSPGYRVIGSAIVKI